GQYNQQNTTFDTETSYNYELGLKSNYPNIGLTTSTTAFYTDRHNPQFDGYSYEPGGYEWVFFTENLESATNYGLETEFDWEANQNLNIYGSLGLLQTDVTGTPINSTFTIENREQAHAPSYQFTLGVKYRNDNGFFAMSDIFGMDSFYFDNVHDQKSKSYKIVNARIGYETKDFEVYLWGKNLTDETYATRGFFFNHFDTIPDTGEQQYTRLGDPRQLGITARVYF
ncbi:MAG: TonB-dependent receptor, partial [Pseudomonadota bacterium]|nr:TonB-dependent receptor [Pseudomonadota bacterium]